MSRVYRFILFLFILNIKLVVLVSANEKCVEKEKEEVTTVHSQIKDHILCDYDKTLRPVTNKKATELTFVLVAEKIDFSDYSSYASIDATLMLSWVDEHFSWNPLDFDNTKKIKVSSDEIWVPDLSIYNKGPYSAKEVTDSSTTCSIFFNKKVICVFQPTITGMCSPDLRHWPYDVQKCTIKIGSWYHAGSELDYSWYSVSQQTLPSDVESDWILQDLKMDVDPGIYSSLPNETFPYVKIQLSLSRKIGSKFICVVLPSIVLVSLTLITLLLDPRSPDRIYFSVLSIPCHILVLLQNSWEIPEYGTVIPYIVLYLRNSNILSSLILIETMVVRYLLGKQDEAPAWLAKGTLNIADNVAGRILLYKEFNANNADEEIASDDNGGTLVEIKGKPSEWNLLGRIIDTLFLIAAVILYTISILICVT